MLKFNRSKVKQDCFNKANDSSNTEFEMWRYIISMLEVVVVTIIIIVVMFYFPLENRRRVRIWEWRNCHANDSHRV